MPGPAVCPLPANLHKMSYVNLAGIFSSGENIAFCMTRATAGPRVAGPQDQGSQGPRPPKHANSSEKEGRAALCKRKGHSLRLSQEMAGLC